MPIRSHLQKISFANAMLYFSIVYKAKYTTSGHAQIGMHYA